MVARRHPPPILAQRLKALTEHTEHIKHIQHMEKSEKSEHADQAEGEKEGKEKKVKKSEPNGVFEFGRLDPDVWDQVCKFLIFIWLSLFIIVISVTFE